MKFRVRRWFEYWVVDVPPECGYPRTVVHLDTFGDAIATVNHIMEAWCRPALEDRRV